MTALRISDCERHPGCGKYSRRLRRRGPRSFTSLVRRSQSQSSQSLFSLYSHTEPNTSFALDERSRESDLISSAPSCNISILHLNIRGFLGHKSELEARIRLMPSLPTLICLNETFLDKSLDNIVLDGYPLISRRDRQDDSGWGGICCFALTDFASNIVCISTSSEAECQ